MQLSPDQQNNEIQPAPEQNPEPRYVSPQAKAEMAAQYLTLAYNAAGGNFYTIAGLSLINTVINLFQGSIYFPIGLGITQIVDALAYGLSLEFAEARMMILGIGVVLDLLILGMVMLFGFFIKKKVTWLIPVGSVLYLLDGVILLLFQDWIGAGFHAYFLYRIWTSWQAIRSLTNVTASESVIEVI
jgi:hypothetical protein